MKIHRWQFRRLLWFGLPLLVFVVALTFAASQQRNRSGGRAYASDDAYRHLVMADTWGSHGVYGVLPEQPVIAVQDVLWRGALALGQKATGDGITAMYMLSLLCSAATLLLVLRVAHLLFPYPPYVYATGALVVFAPGLISATLSGLSLPLGALLVTGAVYLHIEGLRGTRNVLPLSSALLLGLALWLRVEFVLIWLILVLHAFLHLFWRSSSRPSAMVVFVRGLNGWLIFLLFLAPLFAWNQNLLKIPWPRMPGVPMAADAWANPASAWQGMQDLMGPAFGEAVARLAERGVWSHPIGVAFFLLGFGLLLWQARRSEDERPFLIIGVLPLLLPPLYALFYPFIGWSAFPALAMSVQPLLWMVAAYGAVRTPFLLEPLRRTRWPALSQARFLAIGWAVLGGILALWIMTAMSGEARRQGTALRVTMDQRELIAAAVDREGLQRDRFVSDQPGWLFWKYRVPVVDLSAEWTPDLLRCIGPDGQLDEEETGQFLENTMPNAFLLWAEPGAEHWVSVLPEIDWILDPDQFMVPVPRLFHVTWPGVL